MSDHATRKKLDEIIERLEAIELALDIKHPKPRSRIRRKPTRRNVEDDGIDTSWEEREIIDGPPNNQDKQPNG